MNASAIAVHLIYFFDELMQFHESPPSLIMTSSFQASPRFWKPPDLGILKINTNMSFSEDEIGIGIIVRNYLGIPLSAKCITCPGHFSVDCDELLGIIEGYTGSSLFHWTNYYWK